MNQHYLYKALVILLKSLQGPELQVGIVYLTYDSDWVKFSEKKCLRHFLPDCSYELSKGNRTRDFFACLKITTHKLQRALVATSFNNWAAISFTQLWHIGVKSFLNLVSYTCILSKDIYETLLHNSMFYWSSAKKFAPNIDHLIKFFSIQSSYVRCLWRPISLSVRKGRSAQIF